MQVPGNFDAPSHRSSGPSPRATGGPGYCRDVPFRESKVVDDPTDYAGLLADAGCAVDAWETTYAQQLTRGENPVLEWMTGTALRPVEDALAAPEWDRFRDELVPILDEAYPRRPDGSTFFPFRRIFVVAQAQ